MTLTLEIPRGLEQRLADEARKLGLLASEYTLKLLEENLSSKSREEKLVHVLQSWIDEDDGGDQKETGDYLIRVLDEDRLSDRKLFPSELKGVSW